MWQVLSYTGADIFSAVAIGSPVRLRPQELVEEIAVTGMNLPTRCADLFSGQGCADEGLANIIQVFRRGGAPMDLSAGRSWSKGARVRSLKWTKRSLSRVFGFGFPGFLASLWNDAPGSRIRGSVDGAAVRVFRLDPE